MNVDLFKTLPVQIKYELMQSKFTQGNELVENMRVFQDKSHHFTNTKPNKSDKISLCHFLELLMYITNDVMISKDEYKKYFETQLEKSTEYLKTLTHKSRVLKSQIMDVVEDKALLCDFPNVMKFFSLLLKLNIILVIDDKYISIYDDDKFQKTVYISKSDNNYDFDFNKTYTDSSAYLPYISENLIKELSVTELRLIYAKHLKTSGKNKKKTEMVEELNAYLLNRINN